jgi:hypothetical protein
MHVLHFIRFLSHPTILYVFANTITQVNDFFYFSALSIAESNK